MAEPVRHYGKWRIRWFDVDGVRRSEVYPTREEASFALKQHEVEAEEVRRGIRGRPAPRRIGNLSTASLTLSSGMIFHNVRYRRQFEGNFHTTGGGSA